VRKEQQQRPEQVRLGPGLKVLLWVKAQLARLETL
jgi:hypothetical protein